MAYLIVFVVSLAVGVAVFAVSVRGEAVGGRLAERWTGWFGEPASTATGFDAPLPPSSGPEGDPGTGTSYVPVASSGHDWQARLTGVLGLLVSVAVAGIALAVSLYVLGALVVRLFTGSVGSDAPAT